jgi:hypothetical protein
MVPCIIGGSSHRMPRIGHICHKNYGFIDIEGPEPMSTLRHGLDFRYGELNPVTHGRHTVRSALSSSILEFTYIGGKYSLITSHG